MNDNGAIMQTAPQLDHDHKIEGSGAMLCFLQDNLYDPAGQGWTGTHLQNYQVACALVDAGFRVAFLLVNSKTSVHVPSIYDAMTVRHVHAPDRLPFASGWGNVQKALAQLNPRFIYSRGRSWLVGVAAAYSRRHGAIAIWATNGEDSCERWKFTRRAKRSLRNPAKFLLRGAAGIFEDLAYARGIHRADLVINQTRTQRESLAREFKRDGVVIHSIQEVPDEPFVKHQPPVVLWVGQLVSEKRPQAFLDLVERCSDLDVEFRLIGKLSASSPIEGRIKELSRLPNFTYLGAVSRAEVHRQLAEASLIVNTSTPGGDGIPNAMVESWMRRTPALSLELDPDGLIAEYGVGVVCNNDFDAMCRALRELLGDPQALAQIADRARSVAREQFSADANGPRYRQTLGRFLNDESRRKR